MSFISKGIVEDFMSTPSGSYAKIGGVWHGNYGFKKGDKVELHYHDDGHVERVVNNGNVGFTQTSQQHREEMRSRAEQARADFKRRNNL